MKMKMKKNDLIKTINKKIVKLQSDNLDFVKKNNLKIKLLEKLKNDLINECFRKLKSYKRADINFEFEARNQWIDHKCVTMAILEASVNIQLTMDLNDLRKADNDLLCTDFESLIKENNKKLEDCNRLKNFLELIQDEFISSDNKEMKSFVNDLSNFSS